MHTEAARSARGIVARVFLVIACLAILWAIAVVLSGGFDFNVLGRRVIAHEPIRPLEVAALALSAGVSLYGAARAYDWWRSVTRRLDDRWMAAGLSGVVLVVGLAYSATVGIGSDSYGYVSQAGLWLKGDLHIHQPWTSRVPWPAKAWTFSPLGYRPVRDDDQPDLVPTTSPGLPLLMAGATYLGGYRAAFWIVPVAGAVLVFMTYRLGCRLSSSRAGLIGAWLVATSPVVLHHLMVPMTDVPVAAAWTAALYYVLGSSLGDAVAGGLLAALAILIRPNLFPLAGVLALWYVRPRRIPALVLFSLCAAMGLLITALINQRLSGSLLVSGYGDISSYFTWAHVAPNLRLYSGWLVGAQTPLVLIGVAALCLPLKWIWPDSTDRSVFVIIWLFVAVIGAEYFAYLPFDNWTYLRFLLPSWPLIMIGMGTVAVSLARRASPGGALAVVGVVIFLGLFESRVGTERGALDIWRDQRVPVLVARHVRDVTGANSVIFSMFHSGTIRYYGGRMTLRFDLLDQDWLDLGVTWLADHGAHSYLLVSGWEVPQFLTRFQSQATLDRLRTPPILAYARSGGIFLFDLLPTGSRPAETIMLTDTDVDLRSAPPAPPPQFQLH